MEALNLRFAYKVNKITREHSKKLGIIKQESPSGARNAKIDQLYLEREEEVFNAYLKSIKELIDLGTIKPNREWENKLLPRINERIREGKARLTENLKNPSNRINIDYLGASFLSEFTLLFYDEEQKAKMKKNGEIGEKNINIVTNFGTITGGIHQSITQTQAMGNDEIASILEKLTQAVISDSQLSPDRQHEALQNIEVIATEASKPDAERKKGIVRAALICLPTILNTSINLAKYVQENWQSLKTFFGI